VELAVKKIIHGQAVLNRDALRNPESFDFYADLKELQEVRKTVPMRPKKNSWR